MVVGLTDQVVVGIGAYLGYAHYHRFYVTPATAKSIPRPVSALHIKPQQDVEGQRRLVEAQTRLAELQLALVKLQTTSQVALAH